MKYRITLEVETVRIEDEITKEEYDPDEERILKDLIIAINDESIFLIIDETVPIKLEKID